MEKNETESFYVDPIKEKAYDLAAHISPNGIIDENVANIIQDTMSKYILEVITSEEGRIWIHEEN
ncbi:MAG: hypothetical protein J6Y02_23785 [Pseudobutyrivibrio sp.]|nr:hypothetical protein [Pseudobutyrivibrio sp.]